MEGHEDVNTHCEKGWHAAFFIHTSNIPISRDRALAHPEPLAAENYRAS